MDIPASPSSSCAALTAGGTCARAACTTTTASHSFPASVAFALGWEEHAAGSQCRARGRSHGLGLGDYAIVLKGVLGEDGRQDGKEIAICGKSVGGGCGRDCSGVTKRKGGSWWISGEEGQQVSPGC